MIDKPGSFNIHTTAILEKQKKKRRPKKKKANKFL